MPVQLATTSAISSASTLLGEVDVRLAVPVAASSASASCALELGDLAVAQLGGALVVGLALGALELRARLVEPLASARRCPRRAPSRPPTAAASPETARCRSASSRSISSRRATRRSSSPSPRRRRSISSCMMRRSTSSISVGTEVDLDRARARRPRRPGRSPCRAGSGRRCSARDSVAAAISAASWMRDAVVDLVALLEAAQDRDRRLDGRLADVHGLEAALERGVLLDVLAVLVERGGADRAQLAAGEHRLEQVGGVDGALGGAGADDRVQLVDEQDDLAARPPGSP